jgi:hypothetical protein
VNIDPTIAGFIGIALGFFLPAAASLVKERTLGKRLKHAFDREIEDAKTGIHRKMFWLSRDVSGAALAVDERQLVKSDGKVLYLGEDEEFDVRLPFWEGNLDEIVHSVDTRTFDELCDQVRYVRAFVSKFKDLKLAFKSIGGDPKKMALVCYQDLLKIHNDWIPDEKL